MTSSPYQRAGGATLPWKKSRILNGGWASKRRVTGDARRRHLNRKGRRMVVLVGVGRPASRHIMAGVPLGDRANPTCWCYLVATRGDAKGRLTHAVGRTPARWLGEHWGTAGLQLIGTQAYITTLAVLYADWLVFPRGGWAAEFLQLFPQCRFLNRFQRGQQRYHRARGEVGRTIGAGWVRSQSLPSRQAPGDRGALPGTSCVARCAYDAHRLQGNFSAGSFHKA